MAGGVGSGLLQKVGEPLLARNVPNHRAMEMSPESIYDELLVLRCQDGEDAVLEELVKR